eukprot:2270194-Pyramimonas_sp.AAC.1
MSSRRWPHDETAQMHTLEGRGSSQALYCQPVYRQTPHVRYDHPSHDHSHVALAEFPAGSGFQRVPLPCDDPKGLSRSASMVSIEEVEWGRAAMYLPLARWVEATKHEVSPGAES